MTKIRILVAEDSLTVRRVLCDVIAAHPDLEVVGEADNGKRAIELCQQLRPDIVTMDMMMPVMTGLAATEFIMAYCPTPILIVSSSTNRGELFRTYEALAAGAVDVLEKPRGDEADGVWERTFVDTVKLVSRIRVITHLRARTAIRPPPMPTTALAPVEVVAIGGSTGGPAAIVEILRALPPRLQRPVLVVIHLSTRFGDAFADWLDGQTRHRVAFAKDGEAVAATTGRIVMAPPDRHLVVEGGRLRLTAGPERHSCRPSIDTLFESLARHPGVAACLLTGMGRDGAAGMLAIHQAGGMTIAQDEASSVVFGMAREAIALGGVSRVLPLGEIGSVLASILEPE
jgi:two-component system chemotaxis response regulator CheB